MVADILYIRFPPNLYNLTLSWPAGHVCPTYKESFQVRWDNSIQLFLHAAIYLEVSLFRSTSQNAFSRETAVYKWYCVQCCIAALQTVVRHSVPYNVHQLHVQQPSTYEKPEAASAVLGSWWWAVCRPKHVELYIDME